MKLIIILCVVAAIIAFGFLNVRYKKVRTFTVRYWSNLTYAVIAFACFAVMFKLGGKGSLWYDELWNIGWLYENKIVQTGLPIFYLQKLWFSIMPYGQEYLLIISEIFVVISVYIFGLIGELLKGKRLGVILAVLCAASVTVLQQCGNEFRGYSYLLTMVTTSFYLFIKKQNQVGKEKLSLLIIYSIFLTLAMDSHLFGMVTAGALMIMDFILIIAKKAKSKCLVEFIVPATYLIYWFITQFFNSVESFGVYSWPAKPSIKGIIINLIYVSGESLFLYSVFMVGFVMLAFELAVKIKNKEYDFSTDYIKTALLAVPVFVFVVNIAVSFLISQSSLFVNRYFIPIIVFVIVIIGMTFDWTIEFCTKNINILKNERLSSVSYTVVLSLILCTLSWYDLPIDDREDYKGAAEYLMEQDDIYNPSTLCIIYGNDEVNSGFDYYLTQNGKREKINHQVFYSELYNSDNYSAPDLEGYNTLYIVYLHCGFDSEFYTDNGFTERDDISKIGVCKLTKSF